MDDLGKLMPWWILVGLLSLPWLLFPEYGKEDKPEVPIESKYSREEIRQTLFKTSSNNSQKLAGKNELNQLEKK